jgi:putative Mn2+ efflux pump MntP
LTFNPCGRVLRERAIVGVALGARVGTVLGRWAGLAGGLVLIGIGVRVVVTHLLA